VADSILTEDVGQTLEDRKGSTPFGTAPLGRRKIGTRTSFVSVKYFHYNKQNFGVPTNVNPGKFTNDDLFGVTTGIIEEEVLSMKLNKNLSGASGTFDLRLTPTKNWKTILSPGDWVAIYIHDRYKASTEGFIGPQPADTPKNLIMLGNIDRISRSLQKGDDNTDKVKLEYVVSGRNFGKVFEDTEIWFDPYVTQDNTLDVMLRTAGLELVGSPSDQTKQILRIFLGQGANLPRGSTRALNQWKIPAELARLFGGDTTTLFYSILKQAIVSKLPGFKARTMLSPESSGSIWGALQKSANLLVNEIFLEEVRDSTGSAYPTIVCRPRPLQTPFFKSQFGDEADAILPSLNGKFQSLQNLATTSFVEISSAEVIYEDLGKDDHSRLNMYWLHVQQSYECAYTKASNLNVVGLMNPTFNRPQIMRYGLKRFDQTLDFSFAQDASGTATQSPEPNITIFKAFMAQVYDQNYANHLYDVGTITTTGVLEAELGKALVVKADQNVAGARDKVYYIEGYSHEWTFPSTWKTTFTLTHGQFIDPNGNIFIDAIRPGDFGQADVGLQTTYLSKTKTERG
jgi:hypothetical protein